MKKEYKKVNKKSFHQIHYIIKFLTTSIYKSIMGRDERERGIDVHNSA